MPALYKYNQFLQHSDHAAFDAIHEAGAQTPYSGIYRCEGCGHCVVSVNPHPLPPQNHHQHNAQQGRIRWRLIVSHD
jgi:MinD superfamily P-loop ATPase